MSESIKIALLVFLLLNLILWIWAAISLRRSRQSLERSQKNMQFTSAMSLKTRLGQRLTPEELKRLHAIAEEGDCE